MLNPAARAFSVSMMRVFLALMAVLALLVSPVTAAATQVACSQAEPAAGATMDMSGMPGMDRAGVQMTVADPCCDHSAKHPMDRKSCAFACASSSVVTAALPGPVVGSLLAFSLAPLSPARSAAAQPYEPSGLIRPPKSLA